MHHSVLNREELLELLNVEHLCSHEYSEEMLHVKEYFSDSLYWERRVSSLNHIFSIILEQFQKKNIDPLLAIEFLYKTTLERDFMIQEGGVRLIDSLFKNNLLNKGEIEEELTKAQQRLYV